MAIVTGDTILIQRGNTSYKVNAIDYADKAQAADLILVNRGSSSYKMRYDQVDNASSSDWVLVNRGNSSYKASMSTFRDVLGAPITFTVQMGGRGFTGQDSFGCTNVNYYTTAGATIVATVTAKTTDSWSFIGEDSDSAQSGSVAQQFLINGDWIMVAGCSGYFGVNYYGYSNCNALVVPESGQGLSALGQNTVAVQGNNFYQSYGTGYAVLNGGSGAGCPGGSTYQKGGYSQTRPRGENTGSNTWNGITVASVTATAANNTYPYYEITYNGTTKGYYSYSSPRNPSYNTISKSGGKLKDLLSW